MVRPSDNSPGDYSLFFHINNQIQRFRIEKKGVRYLMGGRTFECLDAVINRYRKEQIVEGHTLQHPVSILEKNAHENYSQKKVQFFRCAFFPCILFSCALFSKKIFFSW